MIKLALLCTHRLAAFPRMRNRRCLLRRNVEVNCPRCCVIRRARNVRHCLCYHAKQANFDGRYNDNFGFLAPKSHEKLPFSRYIFTPSTHRKSAYVVSHVCQSCNIRCCPSYYIIFESLRDKCKRTRCAFEKQANHNTQNLLTQNLWMVR